MKINFMNVLDHLGNENMSNVMNPLLKNNTIL